ncbi:MAG: sigma-70 family RNA polymerase sigma factor [Hymenobacter sp.]|nr:sigma-70 family RNA polymerase sigma factor [Hymenobacter sp.]
MTISPMVPEPQFWLDRYGDELYRFALGRVPDEAGAEELVQDTFMSALNALDSFRGQASERTWLFVILKRKLIDHYRRQARHPHVSLDQLTPDGPTEADFFHSEDGHWRQEQYPTSWQSADAELEQQELRQTLHGCQQKLPAQHAAVFVLRFVEELTAEEICKELSLSTSNYWVIVHRAKLQLRRCLEKHGMGRASRA